jgi:hypothetical protein
MRVAVSIIVFAMLAILGVPPANASSITCHAFRYTLWQAIGAAGDKVARPNLETLEYRRPDGTLERYAMKGIVGLDGQLRCAAGDVIEAFDVAASVTPNQGPLIIYRLTRLAAAAVCAVAPADSSACMSTAQDTAERAIKEYSAAFVRGEPDPSGFYKVKIKTGYELEFDASAGQLSFILTPDLNP